MQKISITDYQYSPAVEIKDHKLWCQFDVDGHQYEESFCGLHFMDHLASQLNGDLDANQGYISFISEEQGYWCYSREEFIERETYNTMSFEEATDYIDEEVIKSFIKIAHTPIVKHKASNLIAA